VKKWPEIKRIAFVNPYPYYAKGVNEARLYPPLGRACLSAVLEQKNIECKIIEGAAYRLVDFVSGLLLLTVSIDALLFLFLISIISRFCKINLIEKSPI
jgi:hypothetical protein